MQTGERLRAADRVPYSTISAGTWGVVMGRDARLGVEGNGGMTGRGRLGGSHAPASELQARSHTVTP